MEILGLPPTVHSIILVGDYGSGKTEIAVNLALHLVDHAQGRRVSIADLDLVNPYFRCREAAEALERAGLRVVVPEGSQRFADLPILMPQVKGLLQDPGCWSVLDVGGDEAGSRVLVNMAGAFDPQVHELWFVLNANRPFNDTPEGCVRTIRRIEDTTKLRITGLVPNTHLMDETNEAMVMDGVALAHEVATLLGVPVRMVAAMESVIASVSDEAFSVPLLRMRRMMVPPWLRRDEPLAGPDALRLRDT